VGAQEVGPAAGLDPDHGGPVLGEVAGGDGPGGARPELEDVRARPCRPRAFGGFHPADRVKSSNRRVLGPRLGDRAVPVAQPGEGTGEALEGAEGNEELAVLELLAEVE